MIYRRIRAAIVAPLALAASLLAGCATLERTSPGVMDGLDVVGCDAPVDSTFYVNNYGYTPLYLFSFVCGNPTFHPDRRDEWRGPIFFQDRANLHNCHFALQNYADANGLALTDVRVINNSLPDAITIWWVDLSTFIEEDDVMASGVLRRKVGAEGAPL